MGFRYRSARARLRGMADLRGFNHVDLDLLKAFWLLAPAESISAAVANQGYRITRFTLSRQIKSLEDQLGFPLFEEGNKVQLTSAGYSLLRLLEKYLPDLAAGFSELRNDHAPHVVIGGSACFAQAHWPQLLARVTESQRVAEVEMVTDTEERLLAGLDRGKLQLAVLPLDHPMPRHFLRRRLVTLPMALLVPKDSPITAAEQLKTEKQIPYRAALPETSPTLIRELKRHLRRLGLTVRSTHACSLLDVLHFVAAGNGIGLTLMEPSLIGHPNVRAIPLLKWPPIDIGVVWRAPGTPLENHIVELLAARARELFPERKTRRARAALGERPARE